MPIQVTLTKDYAYSPYRYSGDDADIIEASQASWIVANTGSPTNLYPFLVERGKTGLDIIGGTVSGKVSQTLDWSQAYINSAAVMLRDTRGASLSDWSISQPWDAVRIAGDSAGFEIAGVKVVNARDDAVENDGAVSGTIRDCLFDGVFSGISLANKNTPDRSGNVVTIDGVLMRMESYLYKGDMTHASPMKMESTSPSLKIKNSIFAIEDVNHIGDWRLDLAWDKTIESSGNTFLNLSDTPLPSGYPLPGKGWTILQGQAARDHWKEARADWIEAHDGAGDADPVATVAPPSPAPDMADDSGLLVSLEKGHFLAWEGGKAVDLGAAPRMTSDGMQLGAAGVTARVAREHVADGVVGANDLTLAFRLDADALGASGELFRLHGSFVAEVTDAGELRFRAFREDSTTVSLTTKGAGLNASAERDHSIVVDLEGGKLQIWVDGKLGAETTFAGNLGGEAFRWHDLVFGNPFGRANFKGDLADFDLSVNDGATNGAALSSIATASTAQEADPDYALGVNEDERFDLVTQHAGLDLAA